jgi:hypothetical protein
MIHLLDFSLLPIVFLRRSDLQLGSQLLYHCPIVGRVVTSYMTNLYGHHEIANTNKNRSVTHLMQKAHTLDDFEKCVSKAMAIMCTVELHKAD